MDIFSEEKEVVAEVEEVGTGGKVVDVERERVDDKGEGGRC
jgi:hypothetical protein